MDGDLGSGFVPREVPGWMPPKKDRTSQACCQTFEPIERTTARISDVTTNLGNATSKSGSTTLDSLPDDGMGVDVVQEEGWQCDGPGEDIGHKLSVLSEHDDVDSQQSLGAAATFEDVARLPETKPQLNQCCAGV